jgi:quinol-cytochrome oxidoreductase complex cytochrome b subunit
MASAPKEQQPGILGWIDYRLPVVSAMRHSLVEYPTPRNLNYWWNFGSIAGICLVIQIISGLMLSMHYTAQVDMAFNSVEHIMRDVNGGWLLRYMHAVGASMFFTVVFIHIFRGLYFGSYKSPRELLWFLGIIILLLMMATAFMGYVLPWGQMSFWGATVITNLFSAFPLVGESIVTWLWGGFSVDNPTLNRFYSLHFLLPFVIVGVVILHLAALHQHGSNNPTGLDLKKPGDFVSFHPYYTVKDFFGFGVFFIIFSCFLFFAPNYLGHPDNYIPANPMVTPAHIVPEWYFLPFYAILRAITFDIPLWVLGAGLSVLVIGLRMPECAASVLKKIPFGVFATAFLPAERISVTSTLFISGLALLLILSGISGGILPSKLGGVLAMFGAILVMFLLPWLDSSPVRSGNYRPVFKPFYWLFVLNAVMLGYCGSKPPEGIYPLLSLIGTGYYFGYFLVILPILSKFERPLPLPQGIGSPVTAHH